MPEYIQNSAYTAPPAEDERARRLAPLGLAPADVSLPPLVIKSGQHFAFTPENVAAKLWMRTLPEFTSFDAFKAALGVPNSVFERNNSKDLAIYPEALAANVAGVDAFTLYDNSSNAYKTAINLAYRYAPVEALAQPQNQTLLKLMLAAATGQTFVAGNDLVVENGATVDLGPNPVVTFDRIIVHGTGQIIVHSNQKVTAGVVQWLPN